jgi:hypothetical protein
MHAGWYAMNSWIMLEAFNSDRVNYTSLLGKAQAHGNSAQSIGAWHFLCIPQDEVGFTVRRNTHA